MNNIDLTKLSDDLIYLLMQLNSKTFSSDKIIKCAPLPPSHVKVIFYLINNGSSSISDIASSLGISKPNMTPIIDKLIKEDLVCRQEDPHDRRIVRIELTKKAHDMGESHKQRLREILFDKISSLPDEDLNKMSNLVIDLTDIILKLK
ncbi:MAG: MarR family winged helix-turn-helix transcriptional regulator [Paraclostridium sp.]